jgi:serine protease DegQ
MEMSADIAKAMNIDAQRGAFVSEVLPIQVRRKPGLNPAT